MTLDRRRCSRSPSSPPSSRSRPPTRSPPRWSRSAPPPTSSRPSRRNAPSTAERLDALVAELEADAARQLAALTSPARRRCGWPRDRRARPRQARRASATRCRSSTCSRSARARRADAVPGAGSPPCSACATCAAQVLPVFDLARVLGLARGGEPAAHRRRRARRPTRRPRGRRGHGRRRSCRRRIEEADSDLLAGAVLAGRRAGRGDRRRPAASTALETRGT